MADYNRNRRDEYRPSEQSHDNYYRRGNYDDQTQGRYGGGNDADDDLNRGYSSFGASEEDSSRDRKNRQRENERYNPSYGGQDSRNFSGSNYDRDFDFGMNRRGHDRNYGQYGNLDYSNRQEDRDNDHDLGVRSNFSYNRAGYGSNFGGEYGHQGRSGYRGEFGGGSREGGWAYGNPDERNYSSFSGRSDRHHEEAWERDNRDWFDRAGDEVASWFGDRDAEHRRRVDHWNDQHKGRGPKGYKRSDSRIAEDVNDRLSDDSWVDASDIEVKVENSEIILTGTVADRFAKRRAEDIAERVSGVTHVENRLRVSQGTSTPAYTGNRTDSDGFAGNSNDSKSRTKTNI